MKKLLALLVVLALSAGNIAMNAQEGSADIDSTETEIATPDSIDIMVDDVAPVTTADAD